MESRYLANLTEQDVNDPSSPHFIRFMAAKQETDAARVYVQDHTTNVIEVMLLIFFSLLNIYFNIKHKVPIWGEGR